MKMPSSNKKDCSSANKSLSEQMKTAGSEANVKNVFQEYFHFPAASVSFDWIDFAAEHIFFECKKTPTNIYAMLARRNDFGKLKRRLQTNI
ncbi:MAG: hypothetical protein LBH29_04275 [Elusimicrobiota bacterium]|jgi:hypothetical protein|nr:hypothetical protein [Elusimicrobiota bacterium]